MAQPLCGCKRSSLQSRVDFLLSPLDASLLTSRSRDLTARFASERQACCPCWSVRARISTTAAARCVNRPPPPPGARYQPNRANADRLVEMEVIHIHILPFPSLLFPSRCRFYTHLCLPTDSAHSLFLSLSILLLLLLLLYAFAVCSLIIQWFFLSPLSSKLCLAVLYCIIHVDSISFLQRRFFRFLYASISEKNYSYGMSHFYSILFSTLFLFIFFYFSLWPLAVRLSLSYHFALAAPLSLLPVLSILPYPSMICDLRFCYRDWCCETVDLRRPIRVIRIRETETLLSHENVRSLYILLYITSQVISIKKIIDFYDAFFLKAPKKRHESSYTW